MIEARNETWNIWLLSPDVTSDTKPFIGRNPVDYADIMILMVIMMLVIMMMVIMMMVIIVMMKMIAVMMMVI